MPGKETRKEVVGHRGWESRLRLYQPPLTNANLGRNWATHFSGSLALPDPTFANSTGSLTREADATWLRRTKISGHILVSPFQL